MKTETLAQRLEKKQEQLIAVQREVDELRASIALADAVQSIDTHDVVVFTFGRKQNRTTQTGTVLGVQEGEKGRRIRVFVGQGVDADIKTVRPEDIQAVRKAGQATDYSLGA